MEYWWHDMECTVEEDVWITKLGDSGGQQWHVSNNYSAADGFSRLLSTQYYYTSSILDKIPEISIICDIAWFTHQSWYFLFFFLPSPQHSFFFPPTRFLSSEMGF